MMSSPADTAPSSSSAAAPNQHPPPPAQQSDPKERRMESARVADGVHGDAEEAQGHRGRRRGIHTRPQGPALPHSGGSPQFPPPPTPPPASSAAPRNGRAPPTPLGTKNSGVDARAHKDKLELKAVKDGTACYSALEKKAELYEKLSRGELPDEEDQEKYCVDFFQKSYHQVSERRQPEIPTASEHVEPENDSADSMPNPKTMGLGRTGTTIDQDEHKRFVREVHDEVSQARQKASTMKHRRQEQEAARREKLRQAFLKKRLDKVMAEKQASSASDDQQVS